MPTLSVVISPIDGTPGVVLEHPAEVTENANGTLQIVFEEPITDLREALIGIAATRVEHYANRARAMYAYTDPDAKHCAISVSILLPFDTTDQGEPRVNVRSVRGVVQLSPSSTGIRSSSATLIIYEADYHGVRLK